MSYSVFSHPLKLNLEGCGLPLSLGGRHTKARACSCSCARSPPQHALFPQFKAKICLKGRQKTRPWPQTRTLNRGQTLNTNFLFSNFSGTPGISQQNPGISRPKKVWFPWFRGTYRTFWPPPLHVEDPHPTRKYPDTKVWVWALFSCV